MIQLGKDPVGWFGGVVGNILTTFIQLTVAGSKRKDVLKKVFKKV